MPDPSRKTISATEISALYNVNRYVTRWMLWQKFARGMEIETPPDNRMDWGTRMERLVMQAAAEDLRLEVIPNERGSDGKQPYVSNGLLGCSRDAKIICPDRGPGALETKCVFDYRVWMQTWNGGKAPPHQMEIQLQQQMKVGDGDNSPSYKWGQLAVWCCGDMFYFERAPIPELWASFDTEAAAFFQSVADNSEPSPFGVSVESDLIKRLYPPIKRKTKDYTGAPDAHEIAMAAQMFEHHRERRLEHEKGEKDLKARFQGLMLDAEELLLPEGIIVSQKPHGKGIRVDVYLPEGTGGLDG